jgi:hypothetical protein
VDDDRGLENECIEKRQQKERRNAPGTSEPRCGCSDTECRVPIAFVGWIIAMFWGEFMMTLPLIHPFSAFEIGCIRLRFVASPFRGAHKDAGDGVLGAIVGTAGGIGTSSSTMDSCHACSSSGDSESDYMRVCL